MEKATAYPGGLLLWLVQLQQFGHFIRLYDGGWPWLPPHLPGLLERPLWARLGHSFVGSSKSAKEFSKRIRNGQGGAARRRHPLWPIAFANRPNKPENLVGLWLLGARCLDQGSRGEVIHAVAQRG